jgi:site-specific recombinase XerD
MEKWTAATFASRFVMSGADLRTVAELLRDKTLAMVMRYAHLALV